MRAAAPCPRCVRFSSIRGPYGVPRIRGQLRRAGHHASRHCVARLMDNDGLVGAHGRHKWRRGRHPAMVPAPDLLQRDFTAERSDQRWVADISEVWLLRRQAVPRRHPRPAGPHTDGLVDGRTPDHRPRRRRVGHGARTPEPDRELLHHADHGSQYTSVEFTNRLAD